jgi:hypothetical protein
VGVALGCLEPGVAEHFGDVADVCSAFEEEGGDGVAEEVAASFLVDAGVVEVALDLAREPVGADGRADAGDEELFGSLLGGEAWAGEVEVEAQPEEGSFSDGDVAVFGAFAAADEDGGSFEVDVADGEVDQFLAAEGAGVEDFEDGAVAQAERPGYVRLGEQRRHLGPAEGCFRETAVRSGHEQVTGRVRVQLPAAPEPGEEVADRDQSLYLRGDRQRLAVPLAVLEQPPLVAVQELERDGARLVNAVLLAEAGEVTEIATPAEDRRARVVVDAHPKQVLLDVGSDRGHRRSSFRETSDRGKLGPTRPTHSRLPTSRDSSVRRYYDPATGQFLNVDPAVDQTEAPYSYAGDNPVDNADPSGLCWPSWACGAERVVGAVAGVASGYETVKSFVDCTRSSSVYDCAVANFDPAYYAIAGYASEAQAYENGCSLWTVAEFGAEGVLGVAATGSVAVGGVAVIDSAGYFSGREISVGDNFRISPFGNRNGNAWYERLPHYHRRVLLPNGDTVPGQGIGWHRPWQKW